MEEQGQRGFCGGVEEHVRVRRTEVGGRSSEACVGPWDGGGEGAARLAGCSIFFSVSSLVHTCRKNGGGGDW